MPVESFPATLERFRTSRELTLSQLAKHAGLNSHSYLSRLESGERNPSRDTLDFLTRALDLTPEEEAQLYIAAGYVPERQESRWFSGVLLMAAL